MNSSDNNINNNDYLDDINENSVEFRLINQYGKNNNILNKIYYTKNEDYKTLMEFIKPYELDKDSLVKSNITCPGGRFNIGQTNFIRFSELLKRCVTNNLVLHFRELQASDLSKKIGSGIMFDFDLLQPNDKNEISLKDFTPFLRRVFTILKGLLKIDEDDIIHMSIIAKKTLVYKEEKKLYKNGFHVLIPSIKLSRQAKKLIFQELLNDKKLQAIFKSMFNNELKEAFDSGSYSVPTFFMYNCKENSTEPYELLHIYKVTYSDGLQLDILNKENILKTYNIITELSLNFDSDLIVKKYYELQDIYHARILESETQSNKFEDEREHVISTFNTFESYVDEYLSYYKKIVLDILDIKRAEDRNMWRDTIFAIANINPGLRSAFKPIAELFSMRCENKWNRQEFEKIWSEASNSTSENKLTLKSIIYWANIDNKDKFKKLTDKDIINTIELDVYNSDNRILDGTLYQFQFAHYLNHLFKQKFVYDIDNNGKGKWYEFVLDNDCYDVGEIYKWREEIKPDSLIMYLSNKLPQTINKVILKAEDRIRNNPDNEKENEYVAFRTKNLKNSAKDLYKSAFKDGIIKEAEKFFRVRGFFKKLDSDQNTMGVGNGVLELSENPKLIKDYHNYPISLYTETHYESYNKNNPNTIRLLKVLLDLFPEDEMDAFHYIMYYLASCLDGKPKDSIILILTGSGCHSIDTPIMMYDGTIKKVQDVQINDKLMGDDNSPRIVQELFRGRDQMVRIKPIKGDSFIVNINHVLSLKFTNLISINKRTDGCYYNNPSFRVVWYEKNGFNEPKKCSKMFRDRNLAVEYTNNLCNLNKNVIKKGDIIDIKVKDVLKWNKWWLAKSNLSLYKSESIKFSEKNVNIDPYLLGYWLGDGTSSGPLFTTMENEIVEEFINKLSTFEIKPCKQEKGLAKTYRINDRTLSSKNRFLDFLRNYNLINNKHIPSDYKFSSIEQRLELLAGIIDSDGHYQKTMNQYELTLTNEKLIDDCIDLARSLGFTCYKNIKNTTCMYKNVKKTGIAWRIQIVGNGIEKIPSRLERKQAIPRIKNKNPLLDGFEIELLGEDDYYGFELDQNHRYLTGDYYVHHNSNGKSFFAELVKSIMGKYGAKMAMSFLTESRGKSAGADEQLMLLKNARLAYYSETDKNEVLNTAKLKEITSQETLSGRGIFEKQTNFRPTCSHMVTTNYQFSIKTTDHGIWRRIVTYSFKMKFDDNPDPNNKYEKKNDPTIAKEFSFNPELKKSFLSILVEYYKDLYINHNGMLKNIMKPTIDKETAEYRNQEDIINRFIDEYCIYSPNSTICLSELIDKYEMWYENNISKNHVPEKVEISNQLINSKIVKYIKKGMNKVLLQDIRLKDDLVEIDELSENEYFIREIINNKKTKEYEYNINKFNPLGL
jgi:phage/plasmid-associated DNA primase